MIKRLSNILAAIVFGAVLIANATGERVALGPEVRDVYIDPTGRAILETRTGDWRSTAAAVFSRQGSNIAAAKVLLIDHQHRIWLRPDEDRERLTVQMFDGKTWTVRNVSDLPAGVSRDLKGIHFLNTVVEDAQGNVWLVDGEPAQGWWLHRLKPTGEWETKPIHERVLASIKPPRKIGEILKFTEPQVLVGPDGLFYVAWSSARVDKGQGMGASGFGQFDGTRWSEYFYPTGSGNADNVQSIIPLPDGSVGFIRTIDELRVVWMSSALNRPAPDLSSYVERLTSLSSRERETAQAELIAMGPRLRKSLEALAETTDDPEIKGRIPEILQEISKPPAKGVYGGRFTFNRWNLMHIARSGRVYLVTKNCTNKFTGEKIPEALVTVSPEGVWTAITSPSIQYARTTSFFQIYEDSAGRRWDYLSQVGLFVTEGKTPARKVADAIEGDVTIRGVDASGKIYLATKDGVVTVSVDAKP